MARLLGGVLSICTILTMVIALAAPAGANPQGPLSVAPASIRGAPILLAQAAKNAAPRCQRCTAQCTTCGMSSRCNETCMQNGNAMVQAGPGNCSNWFASAGCKQSR